MNEFWEMLVVVIGLVASWTGIIIGTMRYVLKRSIAPLESRIEDLNEIPKEQIKLEKELLTLKADLPLTYVRREDFIRFDTVINVKLDRLRDLIESIREKK